MHALAATIVQYIGDATVSYPTFAALIADFSVKSAWLAGFDYKGKGVG